MDLKDKELYRLKQLIKARNSLCQLVFDCKTALWEAYEVSLLYLIHVDLFELAYMSLYI